MSGRDAERTRRLAEALRQNLKRRKAQARAGRSADPAVRDGNGDRDGEERGD